MKDIASLTTSVDAELLLLKQSTSQTFENTKKDVLLGLSLEVESMQCVFKLHAAMEQYRQKLVGLEKREPNHPHVGRWKSLLSEITTNLELTEKLILSAETPETVH